MSVICTVQACDRKHYAKGLCVTHYSRLNRTGTTDPRPVTGEYVSHIERGTERHTREHRVIAEQVVGHRLPKRVHVHHRDGNGRNNDRRNLVICEDIAYHKLLHRRERILRAGGNPNTDSWCSSCNRPRPLILFNVRKSGRQEGTPLTYCRECAKALRRAWGDR